MFEYLLFNWRFTCVINVVICRLLVTLFETISVLIINNWCSLYNLFTSKIHYHLKITQSQMVLIQFLTRNFSENLWSIYYNTLIDTIHSIFNFLLFVFSYSLLFSLSTHNLKMFFLLSSNNLLSTQSFLQLYDLLSE